MERAARAISWRRRVGIEPTEAAAEPPPPGLKPGVITRQHSPP